MPPNTTSVNVLVREYLTNLAGPTQSHAGPGRAPAIEQATARAAGLTASRLGTRTATCERPPKFVFLPRESARAAKIGGKGGRHGTQADCPHTRHQRGAREARGNGEPAGTLQRPRLQQRLYLTQQRQRRIHRPSR